MSSLRKIFLREFQVRFQFHKTERPWYVPVLAALSTELPLFLGYMIDRPDYGSLACFGGLATLCLLHEALDYYLPAFVLIGK